jgi:transcriptional regulator NrdR family protein
VTSDYLGRRALQELSSIDVLAAVRFASVFLDFSSPSDYEAFFSELPEAKRGAAVSSSNAREAKPSGQRR